MLASWPSGVSQLQRELSHVMASGLRKLHSLIVVSTLGGQVTAVHSQLEVMHGAAFGQRR